MGPRTFEARIVRIAAEGGPEAHRAAALIRDVTEEKQIERRLAEAERLAALGVLAAGIGHEILCDLMMPQGDGMIFYEKLRALNPELNRKVVFMTGGAFTAQARAFLDSVPNRSLAKPFDPEALRSALTDAGLADAAARPGP